MPYPPLPVEKQYGAWFPEVSTRAVPENKAVKNVESSPVSMHGSGGEQRSETLSQPKKIDMGVLRLWLDGGGRKSKPYDDGPSFDHGAHQIKKVEDGEEGFNFAPGTDEKSLKINWEVYGLESIKSAKLELFCKGSFKPIWELHWGNAWGKQAKGIEAFKAITKPSGDKGITAAGELAFAEVKVDTALKVKDDDGTEETAFPKGLMTVARSPYQLRLTVSGCTADKTPADGDDFVYPMTAWTYAHVLIDSFSFKFGDPKWLAAARDDVHADYKPLITGDNGLEKKIIEELRGFVKSNDGKTEVMQEGTNHIVALTTAYNKNWVKPEFDVFRDTWGLGTRIPIVAMGRIKNLAFQPTDENAADVMWNARLVWDWQEPDPKPVSYTHLTLPTILRV